MEEHQKALLEKYLQGNSSSEERAQLYHYLRTSHSDGAYQAVMDQLWKQMTDERVLADEKAEAMLSQIFQHERRIPIYWYRVAAVLAGLALLAGVLYFGMVNDDQTLRYATHYGETKTFLLPDSSRVTLNANSSLTFRTSEQSVREAWLEGEAFFEVRKVSDIQSSSEPVKFIVHTAHLDVEVLGTAFNVNDRRGTTQVVLAHGKVRLETQQNEQLTMQPGELAELSSPDAVLTKQAVNPVDYTTWRENKLVFKRTPIRKVAQTIEDYYGLEVRLEGDWANQQITGTIPTGSQEVFLEVLAESMGVEIGQEGNRLVLKKRAVDRTE